jgi:hypothetical protein
LQILIVRTGNGKRAPMLTVSPFESINANQTCSL